jgi:predicted dehydrogenase
MRKLHVVVIGAGKIGAIRAQVAGDHYGTELVEIVDTNEIRARELSKKSKCEFSLDWERAVSSDSIDIVVVSTTNDMLSKIALKAASNKKHILVEKPGPTTYNDMRLLEKATNENLIVAKIGFNHRFHPGIAELRRLFDSGSIGEITFVRARHGHGGRIGYEKEWRGKPEISGGGELMDQGVHSLDLINWFIKDLDKVTAWTNSCFWNMPVEDNVMAILSNSSMVTASMNASWTQWRPFFSFEVYGTKGFAEVKGLGGAYGQETLTYGLSQGDNNNRIFYPSVDHSWTLEWDHFLSCIKERKEPMSSIRESLQVSKAVESIYKSAKNSTVESLRLD